MRIKGPFVTLLAGVLVAGVLFGLSVAAKHINTPKPASNDSAAGTGVAAGVGVASASPSARALASPTAAAPTATAPTPPAQPTFEATYAGSVTGGAASLAIVVKNDRAVAYLCDGKKIEAWLQGTALAGKLSLSGKGGQTLTGTYDAATTAGSVNAVGRVFQFKLKQVKPPSGLYRSSASLRTQIDAAWIVDEKGIQTGLYTAAGGQPTGAPELNTTTLTAQINGMTVPVASIDGSNGTG
jgi:hypothetical protein